MEDARRKKRWKKVAARLANEEASVTATLSAVTVKEGVGMFGVGCVRGMGAGNLC